MDGGDLFRDGVGVPETARKGERKGGSWGHEVRNDRMHDKCRDVAGICIDGKEYEEEGRARAEADVTRGGKTSSGGGCGCGIWIYASGKRGYEWDGKMMRITKYQLEV